MLLTRGNKITWLGHSTFKITTPAGNIVVIDPWISDNPATPASFKKLDRLDVMLITHGHGDHAGDALTLAREFKPQIVCIYEMYLWLASKGIKNVLPMNKGGTQKVGDLEVTIVHAVHSSSVEENGQIVYLGEPAGYVLRLPGGLTVYHAGDTALFGDMKLIGELYQPELALLPIGDLYTMGPREAARAVRFLGVRHVVPMHHSTFPALTGKPHHLREQTQDIAGLEIHELKPGETLS
jgi:L-ascorbate metabolism protein UlaG (beta-lactamase superfamily)